ncbi:MAG: diguanylate cyclase/phosphodiesterase with and sensor(s) [Acidobacteria bacterium]|nr:diguanylate cyclase/phosphodiesterase with and sensor(s) [Acidobacteriota bacterium]
MLLLALITQSAAAPASAASGLAAHVDLAVKVSAGISAIAASWAGWLKALKPAYKNSRTFVAEFRALVEDVAGIKGELRPNGGGSFRDVVNQTAAEVKQLSRNVAVTGAMQRTMASTSRHPMFQATAAGAYEWVSETWSRATGISAAEAVGRGWINGICVDDRDWVMRDWLHAIRDGRPFRADFCYEHVATRTQTRVRVEAHPISGTDVTRPIVGYIGTAYVLDLETGEPVGGYDRRAPEHVVLPPGAAS